ncbi:MAG TPA: GMC family oxidoreductase N-terminal domain-containing protein [Actinomycetota bacterium]
MAQRTDRSTGPAYDVVVVGAGSAGAPMAARLSADPSRRVALVEAGPDYRSSETPEAIRGPNFIQIFSLGAYHWPELRARLTDYQEPQPYPSGRGVGGGSALNGQGAVRGAPADYDGWAAAGCAGWGWLDVLPDFVHIEDDLDFGDRSYHGTGGPVPVSRSPAPAWGPVSAALQRAAADAGHPEHPDLNAPDSSGLSPMTWHRRGGARVTTNDGYLEAARNRDNLRVLPDALALRVAFAGNRVVGVVVRTSTGDSLVEAGDVVLCAGALRSPVLLMRSGVGPADELRRLGIEVVADLPGVGANLQDHPLAFLGFPLTSAAQDRPPGALSGHCVLRTSSGVDGAAPLDLEMLALDRHLMDPSLGGLMVALMQPRSRGRLRLASADPIREPEPAFGMLADDRDLLALRTAVREAAELVRHPAFRRATDAGASLEPGRPVEGCSDDELDAWLRGGCMGHFHAAGTCRMGDPARPETVVDPAGRVIGVEGLRVADASIIPELPRAATHLTTVMIAEHVARSFLGDLGGDEASDVELRRAPQSARTRTGTRS